MPWTKEEKKRRRQAERAEAEANGTAKRPKKLNLDAPAKSIQEWIPLEPAMRTERELFES